ncbi:MAG: glycogen debranching protein GlgX [Austwickia sp.]|nr:glycogen debranching protein GlgX [Actinomycetota bacterium]MCO5310049.1 glycogen debranching protein GlgX [Austwickia sp.]
MPDLPPPLGAIPTEHGAGFAVFASAADAVELCLFDADDPTGSSERRIELTDRIHGVWFGEVPGVSPGQRYGYRVHGAWRPDRGLRHNPHKLVLDPYARAIAGGVDLRPEVYGHVVGEDLHGADNIMDDRDSARFVPRSVVVDDVYDWGAPMRRIPWGETVVYEVHVKGATMRHPRIPKQLRGTYAGLAHPAFIEHLLQLGVTTVELLPVHAFTSEPHLKWLGKTNYWGYNTLGFFAPHPGYAAANDPREQVREFKAMVQTFHDHGLEVILDVVYNHTCEQGQNGPTLSWRGLDNEAYYRLDERGYDIDVTGCGNTLDMRHAMVSRMVLDSLRYWATECRVDGFRFDLAVALARGRGHDFNPDNPFLVALRTDPVLSRTKLIAEPWDCGVHGWRTGQFPPPFTEWNDRFRDAVRTFWLTDMAARDYRGHGVRELATRMAGSEDLFGHHDRGPLASVNFVAAHDGFTLADATAYNSKHNEANGEGNRDGHGDNRSYNHGVEGASDDPQILAARRRSIRNLLATTLLATGVPMLCGGDAIGRTQRGNNNAYCQDNETSWFDWDLADWQQDLADTVGFLSRLRRDHRVFRQGSFFASHPRPGDGRVGVLWFGRYGDPMTSHAWEDPRCRVLQMLLLGDDTTGTSFLLVFQGKHSPEDVTMPPLPDGKTYELLWDSDASRPEETAAHQSVPGLPDAKPVCVDPPGVELPGVELPGVELPGDDLPGAASARPIVPGAVVHMAAASMRIYQVI